MSAIDSVAGALRRLSSPPVDAPELLPSRLALACAGALECDGAGISVMSALRVPLGASSDAAAHAERIQATTGTGPCLDAVHERRPVVATEHEMAQRWPAFAVRLRAETPFRSVACLPLIGDDGNVGALDLFSVSPTMRQPVPAEERAEFAGWLLTTLLRAPRYAVAGTGEPAPSWLAARSAQERMRVWSAIGMVGTFRGLDSADALALLRAYSFSHDTTLDALAADLLSERLAVSEV